MPRVNIQPQLAPAASQPLLAQIHQAFGATPNMFKAVAHSPAALQSMWAAFGALGRGTLGARLGEQIAVAIANRNRCEYCLAAHTVLGQQAGASAAEMAAAQRGRSADGKTAAALAFALKVVEQRAQVSMIITPIRSLNSPSTSRASRAGVRGPRSSGSCSTALPPPTTSMVFARR